MKRLFFTFITCLMVSVLTMEAQQGNNGNNRRTFSPEAYKQRLEEFVTREACLTPEEAQKFYPMLHEMMELQRKNNDNARLLMKNFKESMTEAEYAEIIEKSLEYEVENKKIEQKYYKKFHSVLSWKKLFSVRNALFKFNMEALRRFSPHPQGSPWKGWKNNRPGQ